MAAPVKPWSKVWRVVSLLHVTLSVVFSAAGETQAATYSIGWAILTHLWANDE